MAITLIIWHPKTLFLQVQTNIEAMSVKQDLPTLNLLKVFEIAGQHLSFKNAAEKLFVTPSAVSQQIKTLEAQLGVQLFIRKNRELLFTESGRTYWNEIHKQLNGIRSATATLRKTKTKNTLKVSLMPPVASRVVLPNLASFHEAHPNIDLRIEASLRNSDISTQEADLAIRFGEPPWVGLLHEKMIDTYIQMVCPPGFTEQFKLNNSPKNICKAPLIHMTERPQAWLQWFEITGFGDPTGKQYYLDDYPSAMDAAESLGAMLALMPIEAPLISSGRVEAPFPPLGPLDESIYAVYHESNKDSEAIRSFIDWLQVQFSKLNDASPQ